MLHYKFVTNTPISQLDWCLRMFHCCTDVLSMHSMVFFLFHSFTLYGYFIAAIYSHSPVQQPLTTTHHLPFWTFFGPDKKSNSVVYAVDLYCPFLICGLVCGLVHERSGYATFRCDTLTVACCEGRGGRGGQPGLFLKPLWESSLRSARMLHYVARLLTCWALKTHYFILLLLQLQWRTCRVKRRGRNG